MDPIRDIIPKNNASDIRRWIKNAAQKAIEFGITNVHDAWQDQSIFDAINFSKTFSMIRPRMSGPRIGGSGNEISSNAIVTFIPGFKFAERGSIPIGFSKASSIALSKSWIPGRGDGG